MREGKKEKKKVRSRRTQQRWREKREKEEEEDTAFLTRVLAQSPSVGLVRSSPRDVSRSSGDTLALTTKGPSTSSSASNRTWRWRLSPSIPFCPSFLAWNVKRD